MLNKISIKVLVFAGLQQTSDENFVRYKKAIENQSKQKP